MRTPAKPRRNNAARLTVTIICLLISRVESAVTRTIVPSRIAGAFRGVISVHRGRLRLRAHLIAAGKKEIHTRRVARQLACELEDGRGETSGVQHLNDSAKRWLRARAYPPPRRKPTAFVA